MPVHVTGNLQTILGGQSEESIIEVALCGYGAQVPRMNQATLAGRVTDGASGEKEINVDPSDGFFEFYCTANDLIDPANTYYTVTIKDDNGDIIQVNAYQFFNGLDYNLNTADPFDPSQLPPPQTPYLVMDLLLDVPYAPGLVYFPGNQYTAWEITLTGDCFPSFTLLTDGNLYTVIIIQDAVGGHAFNWPNINVRNATWVSQDPNAITIQTFVAYGGVLYAIAPGTYWP